MIESGHIPQEDLAVHAMGALTREEEAVVRAHLETCGECRAALAEFEGDLALVAMSVPQVEAPAGARERFLGRIAANPDKTGQRTTGFEKRRSRILTGWAPWALAAALALCALGFALEAHFLRRELAARSAMLAAQQDENERAREVMDLLSSPRAQHIALTADPKRREPAARAIYLPSKGALVLQASNLAPAGPGKTYELWIIPTEGAPLPAGLFQPDASGSASLVLPDIPTGVKAKAFGVTLEKAEGSSTPTMPILLSGAAPAPGE